MSPHAVNNFVSDLVLMAQAMERLPQVEAELNAAHSHIEDYAKQVQSREVHILALKQELEAAHETIRGLEVAKDAAETMFLEADDRTSRALEFVKTMFGSAGSLIQALEPPQVAQVIVPEPLEDTSADWAGVHGMHPDVRPEGQGQASPFSHDAPPVLEVAAQPNPTPHVNTVAEPQTVTATDTSSSPGPYSDRRYIDIPGWISRDDWLAGGGTQEDYDYRPGFGGF